jgi:hypothetical protein
MNRKYRRKSAWQKGKIVKQHKHHSIISTKELLKNSCRSQKSESHQATESSVPDSAVFMDEKCTSEDESKLLGYVNSVPQVGHSPGRTNDSTSGENQNEASSHSNHILQTESVDVDRSVLKIPKTRRPLYISHWLEPTPDDFKLVADSVEGVRQLLRKYCDDDDDLVLIKRCNKKSRKRSHPSCEVRLARRLASVMCDLECLELKIVTNTKRAREKLYKELQDFENRSADYTDPDEAFWLNEKEPAEIPETQASQNSEILDDTELPQTQVTEPGDASEDLQLISASGRKLRNRRVEDSTARETLYELVTSEESTEDDFDESDNWVMPKNWKNAKKRRITPAVLNSGKKKHASEEHHQQQPPQQHQPPVKHDESSNMVGKCLAETGILGDQKPATKKQSTMTAAALRVKKCLFFQNEASSSEANRQLEWEMNRQKLVNSAASKGAAVQLPAVTTLPSKTILDNKHRIINNDSGKITVSTVSATDN